MNRPLDYILIGLYLLYFLPLFGQEGDTLRMQFISGSTGETIQVDVWLEPLKELHSTDRDGFFSIHRDREVRTLTTYARGFASRTLSVEDADSLRVIALEQIQARSKTIEVMGSYQGPFDLGTMRKIEGTAVYAARKSEQLMMERVLDKAASSNTRKIFGSMAGLHIWENNDNGLQLNIGARGLNPSRSAHFNTRQNGYDISADALGYPEAYYSPMVQAVERIQLVRGAGALQYGTQFGGMLNFVMKEGRYDGPFRYESSQVIGSFGLLESYHALSGGTQSLSYYSAYRYKQSDGWRANSSYRQHQAFGSISWALNDRLEIGTDISYMQYRAQMPGGLTDEAFREDPSQSFRSRNFFRIEWLLSALKGTWRIDDRSRLEFKLFYLDAEREALGALNAIHRPDPMRERDLISGHYDNWGMEVRYRRGYTFRNMPSNLVFGMRMYSGMTRNKQGLASAGDEADFHLLHPEDPEQYNYRYPGKNAAVFVENVLNLSTRWTLTTGVRWEYIETNARGYYRENVYIGDSLYHYAKHTEAEKNIRRFPLFGAGTSFRLHEEIELYANITQNFRSINFSDLTASNPNIVIDSTLTDECGFSLEGGVRGQINDGKTRFDLTAFWINYRNRIGLINRRMEDPVFGYRSVAYRTNIGHARMLGVEGTWQQQWLASDLDEWTLTSTITAGVNHARYVGGISGIVGNEVEYVPPFTGTVGIELGHSHWDVSLQYKAVGRHFSDASNAREVIHATVGHIPAYQILDASLHYRFRNMRLSFFIHNVFDEKYFTRRATAYPGPGIIPAAPRNISVRLQFELGGSRAGVE